MAQTNITVQLQSGISGPRGSLWFTGSGAPTTVANSRAGDLYLNTDNGQVYQLVSSTWTAVFDINKGQDGSSFSTGTGAPSTDGVVVGDVYLDNYTGDLYKWNGSAWVANGAILLGIDIKGVYPSDAAASSGGVAINEYYELSTPNAYGLPDGIIKKRKS